MVSVLLTLAWTFTLLEAQTPIPKHPPTLTLVPTLGPTPEMAVELPFFSSVDVIDDILPMTTSEPTYAPSDYFEVIDGPCQAVDKCAWRHNNRNEESCEIRVKETTSVTLKVFFADRARDELIIAGLSSIQQPDLFKWGRRFEVTKDSSIYWDTEMSTMIYHGWMVCVEDTLATASPPVQPTQDPTPEPTLVMTAGRPLHPTADPTPEMTLGGWVVTRSPTNNVPTKVDAGEGGSRAAVWEPRDKFEVISGPCEAATMCAWRTNYGHNEHCKIRVKEDMSVTLIQWDVEEAYDSLTLGTTSSFRSPKSFWKGNQFDLLEGQYIYWTTDYENSGAYSGWRVCDTSSPTMAPTSMPENKLTWNSKSLLLVLIIPTLTFVFCCLVCLAAKYCCKKEEESNDLEEPVMENQGEEGEEERKSRSCCCCPGSEGVARQFSEVSRMEGELRQEEILGEHLSVQSEDKSAIEGPEGLEPQRGLV